MEVISLNAIVAALKIGKNGQGFSYIAEELRKLSSRITTHTQNLTSQWEKTLSIFNTFRKTIENIQNFQYRFYSKFQEKLNSSFESYNQDVKKVAEVLLGVINEANNIKRPLYGIMEEVQLQDIIKQGVMHIVISLKEIKSDIASDSAENLLDKIFSIEKISDLSINLLDDVKAKIAKSSTIFRDNLSDLDQIMCKVEKKRVVSLDFVNTEGYDGLKGDASKQMFSESAGMLEELLADIDRSMEEKERLSQDGNLIIRELKLLEVKFQDLSTILDRFYPVQVLSRIEIAKLRELQDRTETAEEMTRFTAHISANMEKAFKIIKETLARINPAIRQFTKEAADETSVVKKINSQIKESYERLISSKTTLSNTLQSFAVYSDYFLALLEDSKGDMERFGELIKIINGIKEELGLIREDAEDRKKEALQKMGIEDWKIKNDKIKNMINRFASFTLGKIGSLEVEVDSEEERLTLF
ncbi:hypothetical protein ES705_19600 [subsurface metagenome]